MASYGSFARSARSAFRSSGRSTFRASGGRTQSSSTARPPLLSQRTSSRNNIGNFRRRCAQSMIPLHDAVAAARLVSHLGVNSRSRSALPLGLDSFACGRIRAPFQGNLGNHGER
uniref:Uncharacterized protein n=1 Tax=Picea sitchensis TaxID=3332 RepID=D5ADN6_PICSI|nr:unknown [Picea sitchensis]